MCPSKKSNTALPEPSHVRKFRETLLAWFAENGRKYPWRMDNATLFERTIAELLLQRTQAGTVAKFFPRFIKKFPSWNDLANAPEVDIAELIKPIGLWQRRSISLRKLAIEMVKRQGVFPREREELESLPGIGQYMANAISMIYFEEAQPLMDTNMARVIERYFGPRQLADIRYDPYLQALAKEIVNCPTPLDINFAILDFAALVCKIKDPLCIGCPLAHDCLYFHEVTMKQVKSLREK